MPAQGHLAAVRRHLDPGGVIPGAVQRAGDVRGQAHRVDPGLQLDLVADPDDAPQPAHILRGLIMLKMPADFAGQRDPAVLHGDLYRIQGDGGVPGQPVNGGSGDILVAALHIEGQLDLDLVGDGLHALHAKRRSLSALLLGEALHMAGQSDDALVRGDADVRCGHRRLPGEFGQDGGLQFIVVRHGDLPIGDAAIGAAGVSPHRASIRKLRPA